MKPRALIWSASSALILATAVSYATGDEMSPPTPRARRPQATVAAGPRAIVDRYCVNCHNELDLAGDVNLDGLDIKDVGKDPATWEKAVRKLRIRAMPPRGDDILRPDEHEYTALLSYLQTALDVHAAEHPDPGRPNTFHRLNRFEYQNAIRDLLALEIDVSGWVPADDPSYGFDNVNVAQLSPTLLDRYVATARKVSRLAVGSAVSGPDERTVVLPLDLTQNDHVDEALPLGTRGGTRFRHVFPRDGEYLLQVRLTRDRDERIEGINEPFEIELLLDGERLRLFAVKPPPRVEGQPYARGDYDVEAGLKGRFTVKAGPHDVIIAFLQKTSALSEAPRQPFFADYNGRAMAAIHSLSVAGPFNPGEAGETPSRKRIFTCRPAEAAEEPACARRIVAGIARRAYRRPATETEIDDLLRFYERGRAEDGSFEDGIEMALRAILVSPKFLFRIESDPGGIPPNTPYRLSDLELASRLSFFLWSSIPDDQLLDLAARGVLSRPAVFERQVRRMLADRKADALVTNFAAQWLHLRNLAAAAPDSRLFPDFDDNLRRAFRRETELFFQSVKDEDRSVLDLLRANYTFANERIAKHYGIPNVYGSHFRRVTLPADSPRAGVLGHASVLTVTSYGDRTSPVLRGKWILENILGMPPPPPPPDVPPLKEKVDGGKVLTMRQRIAVHRENPACAGCHNLMDPIGLATENFDAIGRWRTREADVPIDSSGGLPDGSTFAGVNGLRSALLRRPELFVETLTEKLLTYAIGRGVGAYDAPAIRQIIRDARADEYRFSTIVLGVVKSAPFQMRRSQ